MLYVFLIVLCVCVSISAQVTGDKARKLYWMNECAERLMVPLRDTVNFASASEAESYGLKKADTCTDPTKAAMAGRFDSAPSAGGMTRADKNKWRLVLSTVPGDLFPSTGDPKNLLDLSSNWLRYQRKRLRVNGVITLSSIDPDDFSSPLTQFVTFSLIDGTGSVYVVMRNGGDADRLRKYLVQNDRAIILGSVFALGKTRRDALGVVELTTFQVYEKVEEDQ